MKQAVQKLVVSKRFQMVTTAVIILNAIILGVMTAPLPDAARAVLGAIDTACLAFYVVEIALRIYAAGPAFFKNAWNTFDFVIVVLSIIPTEILPVPVQIARILRIFRMLSSHWSGDTREKCISPLMPKNGFPSTVIKALVKLITWPSGLFPVKWGPRE